MDRETSPERTIQEAAARCVAVLVYCYNDSDSPGARRHAATELRAIAAQADGPGPDGGDRPQAILRLVEGQLLERYGYHGALPLLRLTLAAFGRMPAAARRRDAAGTPVDRHDRPQPRR